MFKSLHIVNKKSILTCLQSSCNKLTVTIIPSFIAGFRDELLIFKVFCEKYFGKKEIPAILISC